MSGVERKGNRKSRNIRIGSRKMDLGYYLIVTDAEKTEKNYINGLRNSLPTSLQGRIEIKVVTVKKTDNLVAECKRLAAQEAQYSEPWIMFDRDQVKRFDEIIKSAYDSKIKVAWSNPCIEVWFAAYFGSMPSDETSVACCKNFGNIFQKKVKQKYYKKDEAIYEKLCKHGNEQEAIKLAQIRLGNYQMTAKASSMCPATTLHTLVDEIKRIADKVTANNN